MKQNDFKSKLIKEDSRMKQRGITAIVAGGLLIAFYVVYPLFTWNRYQKMAETEAIVLAESVEALLHAEHIASFGCCL